MLIIRPFPKHLRHFPWRKIDRNSVHANMTRACQPAYTMHMKSTASHNPSVAPSVVSSLYCSDDPANRLGLNYAAQSIKLPWKRAITDAHVHIHSVKAARLLLEVADMFGIDRLWSQSPLEVIDDLRSEFGNRIEFVAVPNYAARLKEDTFTTDWLKRIELFANKGVRICKFWAAPRGIDFHPSLRLDSDIRKQGMKLAYNAGMMFMTHVADPDTWFATQYKDHHKYGLKPDHYQPLERLLQEYHDVPWLAAHMAGHPEDLGHLQYLLDTYPNLHLDTSAAKWMIRELSQRPAAFRAFCQQNPGRILFGTDIVASDEMYDHNLYASRYWSLRTLMETDYEGLSPIVDPDLNAMDATVAADATAILRGANLDPATLGHLYQTASRELLAKANRLPKQH